MMTIMIMIDDDDDYTLITKIERYDARISGHVHVSRGLMKFGARIHSRRGARDGISAKFSGQTSPSVHH